MKDLNLTEEMILLSVWRLKDNAYGVTIRRDISEKTNRVFPYGTLYFALDALVNKGYLTREKSGATPERGGRNKIFYFITEQGIEALKNAVKLKNMLWGDLTELSFDKR